MPITKIKAKYHTHLPQLALRRIFETGFHFGTKAFTLRPETARRASLIGGSRPVLQAIKETICSLCH